VFLFVGAFFLISSAIYYFKWLDVSQNLVNSQISDVDYRPFDYKPIDCLGCPILPPTPTPEQPQYDSGITLRAIFGTILSGIGTMLMAIGFRRGKCLRA